MGFIEKRNKKKINNNNNKSKVNGWNVLLC